MNQLFYEVRDEKGHLYAVGKEEYDNGYRPEGLVGRYGIVSLNKAVQLGKHKKIERIEYYEDELRRILGISETSN